ncbi:hypothetical protein [Yokenella regensburgei]
MGWHSDYAWEFDLGRYYLG